MELGFYYKMNDSYIRLQNILKSKMFNNCSLKTRLMDEN